MPIKVYYLDDEIDLLDIFRETFSSTDCVVSTFSDPLSFVDAVKESPPDLVFLDFRLPGCTGDEVAMKIGPNLPKVLITGDLEAHTKANFVAKLRKPYKISEMEAVIQSYL